MRAISFAHMRPRRIHLPLRAAACPASAQGKLRILHYTYTGPGASRHSRAMDAAEQALREAARAGSRAWTRALAVVR